MLERVIQVQLTGLTAEEIKAKEFYYHKPCQGDITREHVNIDKEEVNSRKECFDKLVQYVQHTLIENPQFSAVSKLSALYAKFQVERNIDVKGVLYKDIKRRLKQEFGDNLMFNHKSRRESEFVFHKSVPIEDERSWFLLTVEEKVLKLADII